MSYTKGQLVSAALNEIGIAGYEFDLIPEQIAEGVNRLDSMMASWSARGIILSYPLNSEAYGSRSEDDSMIPDSSIEAVVTNLALRLASSYGKQTSNELRSTAKSSLNDLFSKSNKIVERPLPLRTIGAGYKNYERPFLPEHNLEAMKDVDDSFDPSGGSNGS